MLQTALHFSHQLLKEVVEPGDFVIDATMGNGHDTAFLAELVGPSGEVFAFDIQKEALINTEQKLTELNLLPQTTLFPLGHEHLHAVLDEETEITAAIFNLGYLPKSNKEIITKPATTKQALDGLLPHLVKGSRIILVVYYGHEGGSEELDLVTNYTQALPQDVYSVLRYEFINQKISHLFFSVLKEIREHGRIVSSNPIMFLLFVLLLCQFTITNTNHSITVFQQTLIMCHHDNSFIFLFSLFR